MDKLNESLNELKKKLRDNEFLTNDEWNAYAQKNSYYSSTTIESHLNVSNWIELKRNFFLLFLKKILTKK